MFGAGITLVSILPINRIRIGTRAGYHAPPAAIEHAAELHIAAHILIFGFAACVAWFTAEIAAKGTANKLLAFVMTLLLGCTTEYLQHAVYHNAIEVYDVFINVVTVTFAFGLLGLLSLHKRPASPAPGEGIPFILRDLD